MDDSLFQNDAYTPSQYRDAHRREPALEGLRKLMIAMLTDAIDCYQMAPGAALGCSSDRHPQKRVRLAAEAEAWFMGEANKYAFSFETVAGVLGFDAERFHRELIAKRGTIRVERMVQVLSGTQALRPGRCRRRHS